MSSGQRGKMKGSGRGGRCSPAAVYLLLMSASMFGLALCRQQLQQPGSLAEPLTLDRWSKEHCTANNSAWVIEYARWHNKNRHKRDAKFLVYVRACVRVCLHGVLL